MIDLETFASDTLCHKSVPSLSDTLSDEFYTIADSLLSVFAYKLLKAARLLNTRNHLSISSVKQE
jgi:hypothetical protein